MKAGAQSNEVFNVTGFTVYCKIKNCLLPEDEMNARGIRATTNNTVCIAR